MNAKELINAFDLFEKEKGIPKEVVVEALSDALVRAHRRENPDALCRVEIDAEKGTIEMFEVKNVVEKVKNDVFEIELEDALEINKDAKIGDTIEFAIDPDDLNRMAAMQAKQVLIQKIREHEKQSVYDAYIDKKDDLIVGVVERIEPNFILVDVGKTKAIMKTSHILPGETFKVGQAIRVYVVDVDKSAQGAAVVVSRTAPGFLKRLFESEIHEVYDGTVEIKRIARQAGDRSKVAVFSRNKDVDATGACIGQRGLRIQKISNQILGEKIDVIQYYDDAILFISEALKPAELIGVSLSEDEQSAIAIVKDEDLSLAIGKKGVNVRLAVQLTNIRIDIKTFTEAVEEGLEYKTLTQARADYELRKYEETKAKEKEIEELEVEAELITDTPLEEEESVHPVKTLETPEVKVEVKVEEKQPEVKFTPSPAPTRPGSKTPYLKKDKPIVIPKAAGSESPFPARKPRKKEEDKVEIKRTTISSKELEELKRKREEARSYMPVYTESELEELEQDYAPKDDFYDDIDFEDYDDYYDED